MAAPAEHDRVVGSPPTPSVQAACRSVFSGARAKRRTEGSSKMNDTEAQVQTVHLSEEEIRHLVAARAEREGICVSVEIDQGRVTLWGDVLCQQALGEIANSLLSIAAITQIH